MRNSRLLKQGACAARMALLSLSRKADGAFAGPVVGTLASCVRKEVSRLVHGDVHLREHLVSQDVRPPRRRPSTPAPDAHLGPPPPGRAFGLAETQGLAKAHPAVWSPLAPVGWR